jgi:tRNA-binding EMAP/Myf-like protein
MGRWEDDIKIYLNEIACEDVDLIHLIVGKILTISYCEHSNELRVP